MKLTAEEEADRADVLLDWIDAKADEWALEANVLGLVKNIAHVSRLSPRAPRAVRERFIDRQEAMMDAVIRLAFVEGFMRGDENRKMAEAAHRADSQPGKPA